MTALFITVLSCFLCMFLLISNHVNGQAEQQMLNKLICIEKEECGACLTAASHCRWCADPYFDSKVPRCNDDESLVSAGCGQSMIQRPPNPIWEVIENRPLQDVQSHNVEDLVQIQPQKLRFSLRPRETKKIKFTYRPAKNYPLDLYILMDLTWSMKDDKKTLVSLGDDLLVMLKNLTSNFRLGFGSFADKPVMPYSFRDEIRTKNPCAVVDLICEATYSYRHHLSLTDQVNDFIEKVNNSAVTANRDNAESQLDALVQTITCVDIVGWSPRSRKIVILLSDGLMHTAGDGKLGGNVRKNDGICLLDERGYITAADIYDYPSIAQIYRLLEDYKVNVIFAVTDQVKRHYDLLHELLEDFTYIAKLESDSSNILKLVKMGYDDIVSVVNFDDDSSMGSIRIKYFTDCGVTGGPLVENSRCTGVSYGMTLNYEAHITLNACPEFKTLNQIITLSETQLGQDTLILEILLQCGCDCKNYQTQDMSWSCSVNSHFVCGVCQCDEGWSGPTCNCSVKEDFTSMELSSQCREPNITRELKKICSGAGDCFCGKCNCDFGFTGRYCQCGTCPKSIENDLECGGEGRGSCMCGHCACDDGWTGETCDCSERNDTCIDRGKNEICSGHGDCVCGKCECGYTDETQVSRYIGRYCEMCATCQNPLCATAEPCVSCYLNDNCTDVCTIMNYNYTVVDYLNDTKVAEINSKDIFCIFRLNDCEYRYTYEVATKMSIDLEIKLRGIQCTQISTAGFVNAGLLIVACVVISGIIVIFIMKIAQIIQDRRAYAKFVKEAEASRKKEQQMNPIYKSPISQFTLPEGYPRDKME